jgi:hypothetical protein
MAPLRRGFYSGRKCDSIKFPGSLVYALHGKVIGLLVSIMSRAFS